MSTAKPRLPRPRRRHAPASTAPATGFQVAITLHATTGRAGEAAFWHAFVVEVIETRGLTYGGGAFGFVCRGNGRGTTEADRRAVAAWLGARREVVAFDVGPQVAAV